MYHRERRKMKYLIYAFVALTHAALSKTITSTDNIPTRDPIDDHFDNNIIDFDEDYSIRFNKRYGSVPWHSNSKFNKESHRYSVIKQDANYKDKTSISDRHDTQTKTRTKDIATQVVEETTRDNDYSVIPLELISTTENILISILDSTTEDLTVIPLSTTTIAVPDIVINQTVTLPPSTENPGSTTELFTTTTEIDTTTIRTTTTLLPENNNTTTIKSESTTDFQQIVTETTTSMDLPTTVDMLNNTTTLKPVTMKLQANNITKSQNATTENFIETTTKITRHKTKIDNAKTNLSSVVENIQRADFGSSETYEDVPIFTELDAEEQDVSEDYYDAKDVVPTPAPKTDALSVIFGLAGSVVESMVESVAERVVPKGILDVFKRMQRQSEALEAEKLRSREENGGLGQFGRGILKSISTGLSKPLSQLMAGVRDIGSLDTDRGFVSSVASGVSNVANSVVDAFKDRVQAIYPGTVWCGDGRSATARSSDLGLFFFTDTCCRQHDACKIYIRSGDTKYGLTNTGLFTRSHCSCDSKFRECLQKTNSLVSAQIGLTYFNVLGPQCFRKSHPIVRCVRKTRITGLKCEEYELDYTKPKMWQWFDNETF